MVNFHCITEPACIYIVREFYANAKEAKDNVVMVRGKSVSFSKKCIEEHYDLPRSYGDDELTE